MQDLKSLTDKSKKRQAVMAQMKPKAGPKQPLWPVARDALGRGFEAATAAIRPAFDSVVFLGKYVWDHPRIVLVPAGAIVASMVIAMTGVAAYSNGKSPKRLQGAKPALSAAAANSFSNYTTLSRSFAFFKKTSGSPEAAKVPGIGDISLTIDRNLQSSVDAALEKSKAPYAVLVAIDPATGKVLALSSYSAKDKSWEMRAPFSVFPMASLVKIVTAASGVENKKCNASTTLGFCGGLTSESPGKWGGARGARAMSVSEGMRKSVNPLFGVLASEVIGGEDLIGTMTKFGFNQAVLGVDGVQPSVANPPATKNALRLLGCGLDHSLRVSPLHAATIMAAVANGGEMKRPYLVDDIKGVKGDALYTRSPETLRRIMSPETARELNRMLTDTVKSGTARHAFHAGRPSPLLGKYAIAAKTGSINGIDPKGHYSWFAAYAPADKPRIALAALVINDGKWKIKAPQLGRIALESYLGDH